MRPSRLMLAAGLLLLPSLGASGALAKAAKGKEGGGGGCAGPRASAPAADLPLLPVSRWKGNYAYTFEPATKVKAGSVDAVIAVVNPSYKETESALMDMAYSKVGKGFSASMGVDMDKVLIAKGMTTVGPYATLDDVTYSDKKNAALTLAPKVFITTQLKYLTDWEQVTGRGEGDKVETRMQREFEMKISGWIAFVMQEPLSAEKMWVKKLELEESMVKGVESYVAVPQYTHVPGDGCLVPPHTVMSGYKQGEEMAYDGKVEAVADSLKRMYPVIMEKCWTYMDTEEILKLKAKTAEIRALKRY